MQYEILQEDIYTVTRWWWIRHASVALASAYIYGHTDLACDCSDVTTFAALVAHLPVPGVVVCSHLSRACQTFARLAAAGWTAPKPLIEAAFAEQAFGAWEGATWEGLRAAADPHYTAFWTSPFTVRPPGGESFLDVVTRVRRAITRLSCTHVGHDIVAIAHAGSIRAALALALDLTPVQVHAIAIEPLSVTRLDCLGEIWQVQGINVLYDGGNTSAKM